MEIVIPGAANLGLFISAALVLLLIPGPAVLYVVARSVQQGTTGRLRFGSRHPHGDARARAGRGARIVGIARLVGARLRHRQICGCGLPDLARPQEDLRPPRGRGCRRADRDDYSHGQLFRDGFVVNLLNPKTALFFLAFLPQFVDASRGHVAMQIAFLGLLFAVLGFLSDGCYVLAAGTAGNWLKRSRTYLGLERYVSGVLFIGLGFTAALAGNHRK